MSKYSLYFDNNERKRKEDWFEDVDPVDDGVDNDGGDEAQGEDDENSHLQNQLAFLQDFYYDNDHILPAWLYYD